jgi:pyruvate/2-oxoglutarate dehydrogenase complex dihydrolipoamide dehydrogenase (E3) component
MSDQKYDLIAISAGSAELFVSIGMNMLGLKVLLIDEKDVNFGGDCLNFGCVPIKLLIHVSRLVHPARQTENLGMRMEGKPDLEKAMAYVHQRQEIIPAHENPASLNSTGMAQLLAGQALSMKTPCR